MNEDIDNWLIKFLIQDSETGNETMWGRIIAVNRITEQLIVIAMNNPFSKLLRWGEFILLKPGNLEDWPDWYVFVKTVRKVPNNSGWHIPVMVPAQSEECPDV